MKNTLFLSLLFALIGFSSCFKITTEIDCVKPAQPVTDSLVYNTLIGNYITIKVLNSSNSSGFVYTMRSPTGFNYNSTYSNGYQRFQIYTNNPSVGGTYTIKCVNTSNNCESDVASFNVIVGTGINTCGLADGIFKMSATNYSAPQTTGILSAYSYSGTWTLGTTRTALVQFGTQPSKTQTQMFTASSSSGAALSNTECFVQYTSNSTNYSSYAGTVYTTFENGVYHIAFCDVYIRTPSGSTYSAKGNLYCAE